MAAEKIDALELNIESKLSVENLDKLIESLRKLGKEVDKVKDKKPKQAIKDVGDGANEAANGIDKFLGKTVRIAAVIALFSKLGDTIGDCISKSLTYDKTLNMFTVSLGEYATNATKYGNAVKDALGIDIAGWQNTQGIFQTLITGFGVTGDQAAYMSQNLTQLSYDIASFYNLTNEEAANKIKSAIAGRLEPIRKLGYDLSQSKLVDIAKNPANYGKQTFAINEQTGAIEANTTAVDDNTRHKIVNFNQLTQQEKVQLRYIALMTQVTQVQGNFARTLNDPANQMKIFKEQTEATSRALGNIFIPMLNKALPYLTAFAQLAEEAFRAIAKWFGYEMPDMSDRMDIASVAEPYNDVVQATGTAAKNAKKLRDYTLGIDELNVLKKPDDTAGGGGGVGGQNSNLSNLLTPGYDFLSQAIKSSIEQAKSDLELLRKDFKEHPLQVTGFVLWEGGKELGSKLWELILGKSPEQLALDAQAHGRTIGEEFVASFVEALAGVGSKFWEILLGSPEEMGRNAEKAGQTVEEAFAKAFFDKWTLYGITGRVAEAVVGKSVTKGSLFGKSSSHTSSGTGQGRGKGYATGTGTVSTSNSNVQMAIALPSVTLGNTAADEARKQGEKVAKAYAEGIGSGKTDAYNAGMVICQSGVNGANNNGNGGQMFYNTAANEAYKFAMGISSPKAKTDAYNAGASLSYQGDKGARWWITDWINAGNESGQGYVAGVNRNKKSATSSGETIGKAALKRLKEYLGIHSPSKAFGEAGMFSVEGYADYMERYTYLATNAAKNMATSALQATQNAGAYTSTNVGYGIGMANQVAMMNLAGNMYNAIVNGLANVGGGKGDTVIMIDGKEVFRVVQNEARKSGVAISNGAFA